MGDGFFWSLENNTWTQKERILILDSDDSTVLTWAPTGTTTSGSTF